MPRTETCIYCGCRPGVTSDHVPPKCFFAEPCPNDVQRITVPCCERCRTADEKSEAFVRNALAGLPETEAMPYVREHITPRVSRSIARARWESRRLLQIMKAKPTTVLTASGLRTGFTPVLDLNNAEMDRVFERVARAALYATFGRAFFAALFDWTPKIDTRPPLFRFMLRYGAKRRADQVFFYCLTPRINDYIYYVYVEFYQAINFLIRVREIRA
jgi:hypothetical protein